MFKSIIQALLTLFYHFTENWKGDELYGKYLRELKKDSNLNSFSHSQKHDSTIIKQNMHNCRISWEVVQSAGRGDLNWPASYDDCSFSPSNEKTQYMLPRISSNFNSNKLCSNAKKIPTQTNHAHLPYAENLISSPNNNHQHLTLAPCDYCITEDKIFTWSALNHIW